MFEERIENLREKSKKFLENRGWTVPNDMHPEDIDNVFKSDNFRFGFLQGKIKGLIEADSIRIRNTVYGIDKDTVQEYAKRKIGRELSDDELYSVKKGVTAGIGDGIDVIISTAVEEVRR